MFEMIAHSLFAGTLIALYVFANLMLIEWLFKGIIVMLGESTTKHGFIGRTLGFLVAFGSAHLLSLQLFLWTA